MCGRFTLTTSGEIIAEHFDLAEPPEINPRYNIAPTQEIATIWNDSEQQTRQFKGMKWGLIPFWSKDVTIGSKLINARLETVTEKPAFRKAIRHQRCLILADGFYEWKTEGKTKQPYYFSLNERSPFAFAGLWDSWKSPDGDDRISCTILTTEANESVQPVHHRMPVILSADIYSDWLNPSLNQPEQILSLLQITPQLTVNPVSSKVNRPTYDKPDCIETL